MECFGSKALTSLHLTFFFLSFWNRWILVSSVQRMLLQIWAGFFRLLLAKSYLAFLFFEAVQWLAPSVFALGNSSFFMVDLDIDTSSTVYFPWMGVGRGFFHHQGKDPATIHHCCLLCCPGHFQFQSSPVHVLFFLRITKIFSECTEMNIANILKCVIHSLYF